MSITKEGIIVSDEEDGLPDYPRDKPFMILWWLDNVDAFIARNADSPYADNARQSSVRMREIANQINALDEESARNNDSVVLEVRGEKVFRHKRDPSQVIGERAKRITGELQKLETKLHQEKVSLQFMLDKIISWLEQQPTPIPESPSSQRLPNIHGVTIDIGRRTVTYKGIWSAFRAKGLPWALIRPCTAPENDGMVEVDAHLKGFKRTMDELHREIWRMNTRWREGLGENIFCVRDRCFCIDPQPVQQATPQ